MRRLIYILLPILLGFNGMLLWQNREKKVSPQHTCCFDLSRFNLQVDKSVTAVFPGTLGLLQ